MEDFIDEKFDVKKEEKEYKKFHLIDYEGLIKNEKLEDVAAIMIRGKDNYDQFMEKDDIDRFIDYIYLKIQNGYLDVFNMAYPTKRMNDEVMEEKIIELLNVHLYPDIIFHLLKYFTRNVHNPDTNLYLANLIYSEEIIKAIYETFNLFIKDIFIPDPLKKVQNVKSIQQFSSHSDHKYSSPLDASSRLKYILEFFKLKYEIDHLFTKEDLMLSKEL